MKALKFEVPIYNCDITFKITKDFCKYMKRKVKCKLDKSYNACKGLCFEIKDNHIFILVKSKEHWSTIAHECLHATNEILESRGVGTSYKMMKLKPIY